METIDTSRPGMLALALIVLILATITSDTLLGFSHQFHYYYSPGKMSDLNARDQEQNIMGVMFGIMAAVLTLLFPSARAGFERERFFVKQVLSYFGGSAEGQGSRDEWRWNTSTWPQKGQFILGFLIGGIIHLGGIIDLFGLPFIAFGMPVRVGFAVTQFVAFHLGLGPNSHAEARQPAQTLTV